jgi:hypothetical protein
MAISRIATSANRELLLAERGKIKESLLKEVSIHDVESMKLYHAVCAPVFKTLGRRRH